MPDTAQAVEEKQDQQQNSPTHAQNAAMPEVAETENQAHPASIDVLLDLDVPVTAIIDKTAISVQRLLRLGPGSVVRFEKSVDAPVDLYLKDVKFATGTIVVIDDKFAVKIKEIIGTDPAPEA